MDELAFPSSSPPERRQGSASPTSLRFSRAEGRVRPRVRGEEETAPSSLGVAEWLIIGILMPSQRHVGRICHLRVPK